MCRWTPQTLDRLEKAKAASRKARHGQLKLHVLPNAGHWLHVDNPHGLLDMMLPSLVSTQQ